MKQIAFDVELTLKELYAFTMRHTYFSIGGIFSLFISFGSLLMLAIRFSARSVGYRVSLLIIGLLLTVVQPLMLYGKCKKQIRMNENINAPLHYVLKEEGITVTQQDQEASVGWYDIRKTVQAKNGLYLYMSPVRAFIFPASQCNGQFDEIVRVVKEQREKYKNYDPEADGQDEEETNE